MSLKALQAARLFDGDLINFNHPIPEIDDPKWIDTKKGSPSGRCSLVWAKDGSNNIFKAFFFKGTRVSDGFHKANPSLNESFLTDITHWKGL